MKKINLTIEGKRRFLPQDVHLANLIRVNHAFNQSIRKHYEDSGLTYIDVPAIVGITGACENIDTLFKVQNRLSLPLFFTQTGQLALEQALQIVSGAYTIIHSGRDEEEEDERHLRQFRLTEEEFDCRMANMSRQNYDEEKMYEALLLHIEKAIKAVLSGVLKCCGDILKRHYRRNIKMLEQAIEKKFLRVSYEEAIAILNKNGYPEIKFGSDLKTEHEATIINFCNNRGQSELPVFIMKYPREIKFFNMKTYTKDPRVVLSADLIFPYAGEGVGAAVREHEFRKLNERLITSVMYRLHLKRGGKYEDFKWYLDIIKKRKTNPHAGYGIGNERVLQYIFGESDIRNVSLFSYLARQSGDWDVSKYGQAAIVTPHKKHILLTVGREEDKKFLLPYLEKLVKEGTSEVVLYATEGTSKFLARHKIRTSLVYKISEVNKTPNIGDMLRQGVFDLIINIPNRKKIKVGKEFSDGKLIRKGAIEAGITLITDPEVAAMVVDNLVRTSY